MFYCKAERGLWKMLLNIEKNIRNKMTELYLALPIFNQLAELIDNTGRHLYCNSLSP